MLLEQWYRIEELRQNEKAPLCVFQEPDLIERTVRDFLTDEVAEVICDDEDTVKRMTGLVAKVSRRSRKRVQHFSGGQPIFDKYNLEKQISNAFKRQVWLPCGGSIVIDETEALIAIDVNTGRNKGKKNADKLILETNLESANEVARQLRLRNIGGLIVVDFIDMKSRKDQMAVYRRMRERTDGDKAKIQVLQLSQLGLMEMTRQRLNESLSSSMYSGCPNCEGSGRIKSVESISVELQRRIAGLLQQSGEENNDLVITVHPEVMQRLKTVDGETLSDLERRHCGRLTFRSDHALQREEVKISNGLTGREINF